MSDSNGQCHSKLVDVVLIFQAEIDKASGSFVFAAHEGRTESHSKPQYLQISYERYSRAVEDFLLVIRLFRRCLPLSLAESAVWRDFENSAAQTLQNVQQYLCISDNRLTLEGAQADSRKCEDRQQQAAQAFLDLADQLRAIPALTRTMA